jgi:hypothetical protein
MMQRDDLAESSTVTSVWPDLPAATSPGLKVRDQLDYVIWVAEAIEPVGFHGGDEVDAWRTRIQRAYTSVVDSMVSGHGDPLPPDIPPALRPGTWPDIASATIPGMTIRHQLSVLRTVAAHTRDDRQFPHTVADTAAWTARVQAAYDALDHGPALPMPESARSEPPQPPPATDRHNGASSKRRAASAKGTSRADRTKSTPSAPKRAAKKQGKNRGSKT